MGLFSKKGTCSFCGNANGANEWVTDGFMCPDCSKKCGPYLTAYGIQKRTMEEIRQFMKLDEINAARFHEFTPIKQIEDIIAFDDIHHWIKVGKERVFKGETIYPIIYDYKDVLGFELLEDGVSVTRGGIGSAVAGGALFGGVGAIAGSVTGSKKTREIVSSMRIKITLNNIVNPVLYISLLAIKAKTNSINYRAAYGKAQQIMSLLSIIIEGSKVVDPSKAQTSGIGTQDKTEELRKYKALLDDGIISENEFNAKKKQLLGL